MGSVIFIDEAYSLLDGHENSYGDEAISTIVAEMENRREDIVVIFAGYTEKMNDFLRRNPGLRSRIAFHVPFSDYKSDELLQILDYIAEKHSMKLDEKVIDKLQPIINAAIKSSDFGNGRFMRNLFEKARMNQSTRLLEMDIDCLTESQVKLLTADDFETPKHLSTSTMQIGFISSYE